MKYCITVFCFYFTSFLFCQNKFSKEFSFTTDNDFYVSPNKDRYYTSGIFVKYEFLKNTKNLKLSKKIFAVSLNQKIYTPIYPTISSKENHDRPFAGYLYGKFRVRNIYKNESLIGFSIEFGALGKKSFAKELQNLTHKLYGFPKIVGWKYQIADAFALNFGAEYVNNLLRNNKSTFDLSFLATANAGTMFTNFSSSLYCRFGFKKLQKIINSIGFSTNLNNAQTNFLNEKESFIYIKPSLGLSLYDATLQGSFLNKKSPITTQLNPVTTTFEAGFKYAKKRFNFGYAIHFYSNTSKNLKTNEVNKYGSVLLGYLFN